MSLDIKIQDDSQTCPTCQGFGIVFIDGPINMYPNLLGKIEYSTIQLECVDCGSTGKVSSKQYQAIMVKIAEEQKLVVRFMLVTIIAIAIAAVIFLLLAYPGVFVG